MRNRIFSAAALAAAAALALSGCAAAGATTAEKAEVDSEGLAAAQALVDQYSAAVSEDLLATGSVDIEPDKFIVTVPCAYAAENCKLGVDTFAEAAETVGWTTQMIDPAGDPNAARAAIQTAVNLGADGIFFMAGTGDALEGDLADARDAGLVTINVEGGENKEGQFDSNVEPPPGEMGRLLAAAITVQSGGTANVMLVNDPEFAAVVSIHDGLVAGLDEFCAGCTITEDLSFQIADLSTGLPTQVESALAAHPETDFVWASYDAAGASIKPVIERSANGDSISMVSTDGLKANLGYIQDGSVQTADVAASSPWIAYESLDLLNRAFQGETLELNYAAPYKLITQDNLTTIPWDGDVDWKSAYLARWGK